MTAPQSDDKSGRNPLPCPFCGKTADLTDPDTLHPTGTGWRFEEALQMRTYHSFREVPREQWCWAMHCLTTAGGCGAEVHGDSEKEALDAWNRRAPLPELGTSSAAQELSALWDGRVPSDPAAAIAKMLGKLDEADKETFNWLAAGFRQVGANWAEARTARSTIGTIPREPTPEMLKAAEPAFKQINAWCAEMQLTRGRKAEWDPKDPPMAQAWRMMWDAANAVSAITDRTRPLDYYADPRADE